MSKENVLLWTLLATLVASGVGGLAIGAAADDASVGVVASLACFAVAFSSWGIADYLCGKIK